MIDRICSTLDQWWKKHQKTLLRSAIIFMGLLAAIRLGYEFHRLIFPESGAIDLWMRYNEVQQWFDGISVYSNYESALYPPASYSLLWPLLKPFTWTMARWLWAFILSGMTGWLIYLAVKESRLKATRSRLALTLLVIAIYPTVITIGNGQLPLLVIPPLLTGILFMRRQGQGFKKDLGVSCLLLFSLLKPNISVPFFWIVLISGNGIRIITFVSIGYGILTFWAASFQQQTVLALILQWLQNLSVAATEGYGVAQSGWMAQGLETLGLPNTSVAAAGGYGSVQLGLMALGLEAWGLPVTGLILILLGLWVYVHRCADIWLLFGFTAIVARVWTYHRLYDDLLILLPLIALLRIARQVGTDKKKGVVAGILFSGSSLALLAPGTLLLLPFPYGTFFRVGQVLLWTSMALFLLYQTQRDTKDSLNNIINEPVR